MPQSLLKRQLTDDKGVTYRLISNWQLMALSSLITLMAVAVIALITIVVSQNRVLTGMIERFDRAEEQRQGLIYSRGDAFRSLWDQVQSLKAKSGQDREPLPLTYQADPKITKEELAK